MGHGEQPRPRTVLAWPAACGRQIVAAAADDAGQGEPSAADSAGGYSREPAR